MTSTGVGSRSGVNLDHPQTEAAGNTSGPAVLGPRCIFLLEFFFFFKEEMHGVMGTWSLGNALPLP